MKPEGGAPSDLDVSRVLPAGQSEVRLQPDPLEDDPGGEETAPVELPGQMEQRRALHHGVVQVEEAPRRRHRSESPVPTAAVAASSRSGPGAASGSDGSTRIAEASLSASGSTWSACPDDRVLPALRAAPSDPVTAPP